jgi:geranylgeranyl pyrophosphate synthase
VEQRIAELTEKALAALDAAAVDEEAKAVLRELAVMATARKS